MSNLFNFKRKKVVNSKEKESDISTLIEMAYDIRFMQASNGRDYFYYFVNDPEDLTTIRGLLKKHGLNPSFHLSKYYFSETPSFRVRQLALSFNSRGRQFAEELEQQYEKRYRPKVPCCWDKEKSKTR